MHVHVLSRVCTALDSGQLDYALEQWTEAVQVLQKLYHNEQVFLLKYRLLMKQRKAAAYR
jgi:ABC-type proline/glycine betaine transport system substrate-binding protein